MWRPRLIFEKAFVVSCAALIVCPSCSLAAVETMQSGSNFANLSDFERDAPGQFVFKMQATHNLFEYPEGMRNYKRPPTVDSKLVGQIMQVRMALPSWRGIAHLMPGGGGSAR